MYIQYIRITFDPKKRELTLKHRKLDFKRANEVFDGLHYSFIDDREDYGEIRYITVGYLDKRMVVMVWTKRGETRRIISMRKANAKEQTYYREEMDG